MATVTLFFTGITLILVAISCHEFAHAWAADRLGDPTARYRGRVTLDPLAHLDPMGTLMILFTAIAGVGIGWGKPVPVVPANFRRQPHLSMALASGSGPVSNLIQAAVAAALLHAVRASLPEIPAPVAAVSRVLVLVAGVAALAGGGLLIYRWYQRRATLQVSPYGDLAWRPTGRAGAQWWQDEEVLRQLIRGGLVGVLLFGFVAGPESLLLAAVYINIALALFNLIPLGPLDGNGILRGLLLSSRAGWTYRVAGWLDRIEPHSGLILFGVIFLEQFLRVPILSGPLWGATRLIAQTILGV